MSQSILECLQWRYAVKDFDPSKKLSDAQVDTLLESLRLSPSSWGLQPWGFVVVNSTALRAQLLEHSWGQRQVVDASHLIVLCRKANVTAADVEALAKETTNARHQEPDSLEGFVKMVVGFLERLDEAGLAAWMKDQVYLALGTLLTVCAVEGIDACPMEGFVPQEYDRILGLEEKGLRSIVLCPVGHRAETDKYATLCKVRYPAEQVISFID